MKIRSKILATFFSACLVSGPTLYATSAQVDPQISNLTIPALDRKAQKNLDELLEHSKYAEKKFVDLGVLYEDPELIQFLNGLWTAEELGVSPEKMVSVKVIRDPSINASAYPSGQVYLNLGLLSLLTVDEIRFVIAHEYQHAIGMHSLAGFQSQKGKTTAVKLLQMAVIPAAGLINVATDYQNPDLIGLYVNVSQTAAGVVYVASVSGYGRLLENQADYYAAKSLHENGYGLKGAYGVFDAFERERETYGGFKYTLFYMNHESNVDRRSRIAEYEKAFGDFPKPRPANNDALYETLRPRVQKEDAQVKTLYGFYQHALEVLLPLSEKLPNDPEVFFLLGENYRTMKTNYDETKDELGSKFKKKYGKMKKEEYLKSWGQSALEAYQKTISLDPQYAQAYRGIAQYHDEDKQYQNAKDSYAKYLQLKPDAKDKRFVQAKIELMQRKLEDELIAKSKKES